MAMPPLNWLIQEYSTEWLNRKLWSSLLVDNLADLISADHLLWHAHSIKSILFLSFLDHLLSSGICTNHLNLSIISDWLWLPPWLTIQVSYMDASIYSPQVCYYSQWEQACLYTLVYFYCWWLMVIKNIIKNITDQVPSLMYI